MRALLAHRPTHITVFHAFGSALSNDPHVGIVGYEITFNRYFYRDTPPCPLEEIDAGIRAIETDIMRMLSEVTGGAYRRLTA